MQVLRSLYCLLVSVAQILNSLQYIFEYICKQAGAELGQAQVKLEGIV